MLEIRKMLRRRAAQAALTRKKINMLTMRVCEKGTRANARGQLGITVRNSELPKLRKIVEMQRR